MDSLGFETSVSAKSIRGEKPLLQNATEARERGDVAGDADVGLVEGSRHG